MFLNSLFTTPSAADKGSEESGDAPGVAPIASGLGFDLWAAAASVSAAVTKTVQQSAHEIVQSVQNTDWQSELQVFSKEASKAVKEDAQTLKNKTAEAVELLPDTASNLPAVVASKLPRVSESGAAVGEAMEHALENVGESLTQFGKSLFVGTQVLLEQVRDGIEEEIAAATKENKRSGRSSKSLSSLSAQKNSTGGAAPAKYNRFEAEVSAIQRDSGTYLDEPEDTEDFERWKLHFSIPSAQPDIDKLLASNSFMSELFSRIVPEVVEGDEFWTRYFYRIHKLQAKEGQRAELAQRTQKLSVQEEEDLGWDDLEPGDSEASPPVNIGSGPVASSATISAIEPSISPETNEVMTSSLPELNPLELFCDVPNQLAAPEIPVVPHLSAVDAPEVSVCKPLSELAEENTSSEIASKDAVVFPSPNPALPHPEEESTSEGSGGKEWSVVSSPSKEPNGSPGDANVEQKPKQERSRGPPRGTGEGEEDLDWGNWD